LASVTFYGQTITTTDLSCTSVKPAVTSALNWQGWTATSCSTDPVAVNTIITFTYQVNGATWTNPITAVVDNPPSTTTTSQTCTPEPFDYAYAAQVWALAFSVTVGLYLIALKVGTVLRVFKRF
jgi:hypothetical protein